MGISTIKFSLKSGFSRDRQEQVIEGNHATAALAWGKVCNYDTDGVVTVANDYGYFAGLESTTDGPSELEMITGDYQMYEVKVGKPIPLFIPVEGGTVYTVHVAAGTDTLAKGKFCAITNGIYVANTGLDATTAKGKIIGLPADTGRSDLYVVEIMNS